MKKLKSFTLPEVLIGINILMFLLVQAVNYTIGDGLIRLGAKVDFLIALGEYWRLFTAMFLHADLMHLLFNMLALYIFGRDIEHIFGRKKFALIYFLSGLAGSALSYLLSDSISVGASGAIFGLMGANLFLYKTNPAVYKRIYGMDYIMLIGINLVMGFIRPNIDMAGHIGGLIGGFLSASALGILPNSPAAVKKMIFNTASVLVIILPIVLGTLSIRSKPDVYITGAYYYFIRNNSEKAISVIDEGIRKHPENQAIRQFKDQLRIN